MKYYKLFVYENSVDNDLPFDIVDKVDISKKNKVCYLTQYFPKIFNVSFEYSYYATFEDIEYFTVKTTVKAPNSHLLKYNKFQDVTFTHIISANVNVCLEKENKVKMSKNADNNIKSLKDVMNIIKSSKGKEYKEFNVNKLSKLVKDTYKSFFYNYLYQYLGLLGNYDYITARLEKINPELNVYFKQLVKIRYADSVYEVSPYYITHYQAIGYMNEMYIFLYTVLNYDLLFEDYKIQNVKVTNNIFEIFKKIDNMLMFLNNDVILDIIGGRKYELC